MMEQIRPKDRRHKKLVNLVKNCFELSQRTIEKRYDNWEKADKMDRSYIDVSETDTKGRKKNPFERQVYIPMSRAIKDTILTYFMQVFFGQRPFLKIEGRGPEDVKGAKIHEIVLDYQMERQGFLLKGYNFLNDILKYSFGDMKLLFGRQFSNVFRVQDESRTFPFTHTIPVKTQEKVLTYEGPVIHNSDPYRTFPDPRVPVCKVQEGQFKGYLYRRSRYYLMKMHQQNVYFNIEYLRTIQKESWVGETSGGTSRNDTIGMGDMEDHYGIEYLDKKNPFYTIRELWVELIPKDFGLSESRIPEKWVLATANNQLLIRANASGYAHEKIPDVVGEFDYDGYSMFTPGFYEGVKGLNDLMNWLFNSHIENVMKFMNNQALVDPQYVNTRDITKPRGGKLIRLKKSLAQQNINTDAVFKQLQVYDVTKGHINDANLIADMMQRRSHTPDQLQGVETEIKRTATEISKMASASTGILTEQAKLIFAQAFVPFAEMCVMNNQQMLTQQMYYRISGDYMKDIIQPAQMGDAEAILAGPNDIQGVFDYPINDGNLPIRASDNSDVWREVFQTVGTVPPIQMQIDIWWVFKQLCNSLGVKNIEDARIQQASVQPNIVPDERALAMEQAGDVLPISQLTQ